MTATTVFSAGERVTVAYRGRHTGVVLDPGDPRAWAHTLAFPDRSPSVEEVERHLDDCAARGLSLGKRLPIRWCFGATEWEAHTSLRPTAGSACPCRRTQPP